MDAARDRGAAEAVREEERERPDVVEVAVREEDVLHPALGGEVERGRERPRVDGEDLVDEVAGEEGPRGAAARAAQHAKSHGEAAYGGGERNGRTGRRWRGTPGADTLPGEVVPNVSLAISGLLGWTAGAAVAVVALLVAISFVKLLARMKVAWWPSLVAPAAAVGPALGLLTGAWLTQGELAAVAFWAPEGHPAARVG